MKGEANGTLTKLPEVAIIVVKRPRVVFEEFNPKNKVKTR
jgi:hypothetical protein